MAVIPAAPVADPPQLCRNSARFHRVFPVPQRAKASARTIGRQPAVGKPLPVPHDEEDRQVTVFPVLEEVLVLEKRLVLRADVRLRRSVGLEAVAQSVDVRRQHAEVTRPPTAGQPNPPA